MYVCVQTNSKNSNVRVITIMRRRIRFQSHLRNTYGPILVHIASAFGRLSKP